MWTCTYWIETEQKEKIMWFERERNVLVYRMFDLPNRSLDIVDDDMFAGLIGVFAEVEVELDTNVQRAEPVRKETFLVLSTNSYGWFSISNRSSVSFNNEQDLIGERWGSLRWYAFKVAVCINELCRFGVFVRAVESDDWGGGIGDDCGRWVRRWRHVHFLGDIWLSNESVGTGRSKTKISTSLFPFQSWKTMNSSQHAITRLRRCIRSRTVLSFVR